MTFFFTADTHFGHARAAEIRGFTGPDAVKKMNDTLIERWNDVVRPGDTVYHLGDFGLGQKVEWPGIRARLSGSIVFVPGNHDMRDPHDPACTEVHPKFSAMLLPGDRVLDDLFFWTMGCSGLLEGGGICFHGAHAPSLADFDDGRGYIRRPTLPGAQIELCGHVHERWVTPSNNGRMGPSRVVNVGVDVSDFTPITVEQILREVPLL